MLPFYGIRKEKRVEKGRHLSFGRHRYTLVVAHWIIGLGESPKGELFMEEMVLKAVVRDGKVRRLRREGFTPGVLNESDTTSTPVQFETAALKKLIERHGANARVWIELDGKKHFGFLKEVQKHAVDWNVIHVSVQLIGHERELKMHIPITFHGREELGHRQLQLLIHKSDVEVEGQIAKMPDSAVVDVAGKESGYHILAADIQLPDGIRILDAAGEIYAVVKIPKAIIIEEDPAKAATPAADSKA
jgi:large subunit ribosomal protein L25